MLLAQPMWMLVEESGTAREKLVAGGSLGTQSTA